MMAESISNVMSNLAITLVMLFSGLQLWWAIEALDQARRMEADSGRPAASQLATADAW